MKAARPIVCLFFLVIILASLACASKPKTSTLLRDPLKTPRMAREIFDQEGKSDYFLFRDEGYSIRLIYLCENQVYNFLEEPQNNHVLVSLQPILETSVEKKLPPDDRRRIWACMERKVREEQGRVDDRKRGLIEERERLEKELGAVKTEGVRLTAEIEKKKLLAEKQQQNDREMRRTEEERLRRVEEERHRKAEEERKIKSYKSVEKEDLPAPPPSPKFSVNGTFLVMKETEIFEDPTAALKLRGRSKKYDIFEVINSKKNSLGIFWHQIVLGDRMVTDKGKKTGWSPEERSYWIKNKLSVVIYPGDPSRINAVKPLKLNVEELQFTGKKVFLPQKPTFYEVIYEQNTEYAETLFGWVEDKNGIRRSNKSKEEMRDLLKDLARTLWPLRIQNDILKGFIRTGFTPEQVILSWGNPDHINKTRTLVGEHEQWVYGENPFPSSFVYFENGLVKSWEFLKKSGK